MQEAFGGILSLVLIVVFIVIVEGVLGFTVAYTKAFRMKNATISAFEEYEGIGCGLGNTSNDTACLDRIRKNAKKLTYAPPRLNCSRTTSYGSKVAIPVTAVDGLFCASQIDSRTDSSGNMYATYRIFIQVDMNFPIVKDILGFNTFKVTGDTREIQLNRD